jgi:nucleotide-binding universal stress UspA family protein
MQTNRHEPAERATTIVVGVDASASSQHALAWCAEHARGLGAESIVVVHALHLPYFTPFGEFGPVLTAPVMDKRGCARIRAFVTEEWCQPLRDAEVEHSVLLLEGAASVVVGMVAARVRADLVVIGATEEPPPQLDRPLVIVP